MLYELRHQDPFSGRSLKMLERQMEAALQIWQKLGIEFVGFWSVLVGPTSPRLTSLLAWESLEQRERLWDAFLADPDWLRLQQETPGEPMRRLANMILRPIPNSPIARYDNQPARLTGGLFELRVLTQETAAKQRGVVEWFADKGRPQMEKHGMFLMGLWETTIGVSPQLTYMLVFENLAHRERAWAAYHTDPAYAALQDGLYPDGQPLISHTESCVMRGTEFSGWR